MTRPTFPLIWDNTMRTDFVACPRKWAWSHLDNWHPRGTLSVHLHAGACWASAVEAVRTAYYCDSLPPSEAIGRGLTTLAEQWGNFEPPPTSPKTLPRLLDALVYYFTAFPLETDPAQPHIGPAGPMLEFSFILPVEETGPDALLHPESGEPILFSGRADMLATYAGALTIFDDKTTTSLGAQWSAQWDMRAQFTGYAWAAREFGLHARQVLARGIAILKTQFNHAQAITHRPDHRINAWHSQIKRDIRRAMSLWREGCFDFVESDACNAYGGCLFRQPCQSADPQPWLETGFVRSRWDPVTRSRDLLG